MPKTIDNLDISAHVTWAKAQASQDPFFEAGIEQVASRPEIMGMSVVYPSQFDLLFDLQKRNLTWASFQAPHYFYLFGKRFFSHRLFMQSNFLEDDPRILIRPKEKKTEELQEKSITKLLDTIAELKKMQHQTHAMFEKDKTTLLKLLESIEWINSLLKHINGKKLQYQKG